MLCESPKQGNMTSDKVQYNKNFATLSDKKDCFWNPKVTDTIQYKHPLACFSLPETQPMSN